MDQAGQIYSSDVAFTPSVKAVQERKGSRAAYARVEQGGSWATHVTAELAAFIAEQTSLFLATASAAGQPYIQHRGGPPGFLRVLDETTLGFVDFVGNKQFITLGNLAENDQAQLFLIDYATRRRIKIWGRAEVVEGDEKVTGGADAVWLSRETVAGHPVQGFGLGRQLPAAYSVQDRRSRCQRRSGRARRAHSLARSRSRGFAGGDDDSMNADQSVTISRCAT